MSYNKTRSFLPITFMSMDINVIELLAIDRAIYARGSSLTLRVFDSII